MPYSKEEIDGLMREARQLVIADLKAGGKTVMNRLPKFERLWEDTIRWEALQYLGAVAMRPSTRPIEIAVDELVKKTALALAAEKLEERFK